MTRHATARGFCLALLLGVAVLTFANSAWSQQLEVEVAGADLDTVVLRDAAGDSLGLGSDTIELPEGSLLENADFVRIREDAVEFVMPVGPDYVLSFLATDQPFDLSIAQVQEDTRLRVVIYDRVVAGDGRAASLSIAAAGDLTLRIDSTGDGTPDTVVPASADVSGAEAGDETPPEILHTRRADGTHELQILQGGSDITSPDRLFYSLDGGDRYLPYTGPIALDPRNTPTLFAIGRDRVGNTSRLYDFATAKDFCERIQDDRAALRSLVASGLNQAQTVGLLGTEPGISVLAHGRAACLWRRNASGSDRSCQACGGVYVPGSSAVSLALLFPDAVSATDRAAIRDLFSAASEANRAVLPEVSFSAESRADFEAARVSLEPAGASATDPVGDGALAGRLRLLERALAGEYLDLGVGAPNVEGASLSSVLAALRNEGGIPRLEGLEAAWLREWRLLRSGLMLRIAGLGSGIVAGEPERDSFENRLLRDQLLAAAGAVTRGSLALLATDDCGVENALAFQTRPQYATSACGGLGCTSFEQYAAARVIESQAVCPGVFADEEITDLRDFAAVSVGNESVLEALFGDECAANTLLGKALLRVRDFQARSQVAYDAGLSATGDSEREQRLTNAAAVRSAISLLLANASQDLMLRLANTGSEPFSGVVLRMYEDGVPNDQELSLEIPPDTALILEGDAASDRPFFLRRSAATGTPNEIFRVAFVIDPEGSFAESTAGRKLSGLDAYIFNPNEPICPVPAPPRSPLESPPPEGAP